MCAVINDSYWWYEALTALEKSHDFSNLDFDSLRRSDPSILEHVIKALELALMRHRAAGSQKVGFGPATPLDVISRAAVVTLIVCQES